MRKRDLPSQQITDVAAQGAGRARKLKVRRIRHFEPSVDSMMAHSKQLRLRRAFLYGGKRQRFEEYPFEVLVIGHSRHGLDDRPEKKITGIVIAPKFPGFRVQCFDGLEIVFDSLLRGKRFREGCLRFVNRYIVKP